MGFIEIELMDSLFEGLTLYLASMAPIPFPSLPSLAGDQLISSLEWKLWAPTHPVSLETAPSWYIARPGFLPVAARLNVHHVSIADLDLGKVPTISGGVAWLVISNSLAGLTLELIGLDLDAKVPVRFERPISLLTLGAFGQAFATLGSLYDGALLHADGVSTIRYGTAAGDDADLLRAPANRLNRDGYSETGDAWLIRISGDVFASVVSDSLTAALSPPPTGLVVDASPTTRWGLLPTLPDRWGVIGGVGLKKVDACPTIVGDADISIDVSAFLWLDQIVPAGTSGSFNLFLNIGAVASDWDTMRCYAGNLGLASLVLTFVSPLLGIVAGLSSYIGLGFSITNSTGDALAGLPPSAGMTQIEKGSDYVIYESGPLPLPAFPKAQISTSSVTADGFITTGKSVFITGLSHTMSVSPPDANLRTGVNYAFNCQRGAWERQVVVMNATISDAFGLAPGTLPVPVTIFPTSMASPSASWSVAVPSGAALDQVVSIIASGDVKSLAKAYLKPPSAGRAYIHSSVGIQRFDIDIVPSKSPPGDVATLGARVNCERFAVANEFLVEEMLRWLIDPPDYGYGMAPLRQWLLTFASLELGSGGVEVQMVRTGRSGSVSSALRFGQHGKGASIELVTDSETELRLSIPGASSTAMHSHQRWLLPTQIIDLEGSPLQLVRMGNTLAVQLRDRLIGVNLATGRRVVHQVTVSTLESDNGAVRAHGESGSYVMEGDRLLSSSSTTHSVIRRNSKGESLLPISVRLPGGRVAAIWGEKLVFAQPWEKPAIASLGLRVLSKRLLGDPG